MEEQKQPKKTPYKAHYAGVCSKCSGKIEVGQFIAWPRTKPVPGKPKNTPYHKLCNDPYFFPCYTCEAPTPNSNGYCSSACSNGDKPTPKTETKKCTDCGMDIFYSYHDKCAACARRYDKAPSEAPIPKTEAPSMPNEDEAFKMEIPSEEPSFDDKPKATQWDAPKSTQSTGDGLLDIISAKVQENVIENVRRKVDSSIDAIDRIVKEKLDKLAIPSIEVKRYNAPPVTIHNVHKQFNEVLELLVAKEYPYLHGSPGAGKTTLGPKLAEALGVRFDGMSLCEQSPEYKLSGYSSPIDGKFFPSAFVDFYENGGLFQWSEMDAANDNLRVALNTALDNKYLSTDKGMIPQHKDFFMIADGNTCGRGAHPAFPSRTAFDAAFAARFIFVEFEYDWSLTKVIALGINEQAGPIVQWAEKVSNWALANQIQLVMSPREVFKLAKLFKITKTSEDKLLAGVLRGLDIPSKEKMLANYPFPKIARG